METIALIGAGGHCKVVIDLIKLLGNYRIVGIYDDEKTGEYYGYKILDKISKLDSNIQNFIISIGDNYTRKCIVEKNQDLNWRSLLHPSAIISENVQIGKGSIVCAGSIIQTDVKIGEHCIINTGCCIDHECVIDNYTSICPKATLCGNVIVGSSCFIGANSTIIENLKIGNKCIIGAGSAIIKNVRENCKIVGNPGRIIENHKDNANAKLRCLLLDNLFPIAKAQWRLVEIHSFIEKYDTDILVQFTKGFGGPDYKELCDKFHLSELYDILIFDPQYNYLNQYNETEFNGTHFNNALPYYSFLFRLKKFRAEEVNCPHPPMGVYNFIYSIFVIPYLQLNYRFNNFFPHEKQFIHLYPGGGCRVPIGKGLINIHRGEGKCNGSHISNTLSNELQLDVNPNWKKSKWLTTQDFIYTPLNEHNPDNIYKVYGCPFFYKGDSIKRKSNFNETLNVCFTSLGNAIQKGADIYINIADQIKDANIKFFSVGNCPSHENITHLNVMSQEELSKFYYEKIDIYINLSRYANGFPLGVEAGKEGCVLLTSDPYNSNINNNFNIDDFFIIDFNDVNSIIKKIISLKNINFRKEKSHYIQDKLYDLFSYETYMENGVFSIIEKNICEE
jgi:sugar O-acyltransferase (sialic acid O-acetyltransferase NeuD family)